MIWTIARKEFLTSLLTWRFAVGLVLCLISVTAGTLAAVQDLRIEFADRVFTEAWRPVESRMRTAAAWTRWLSLLSPAGAYQDAAAILARTDRGDYWSFLDQTRAYRQQLIGHYQEQRFFSSRQRFNDQAGKVALVGLPRFREERESLWQAVTRARASLLVLVALNLAAFLAAYARFRRADMR